MKPDIKKTVKNAKAMSLFTCNGLIIVFLSNLILKNFSVLNSNSVNTGRYSPQEQKLLGSSIIVEDKGSLRPKRGENSGHKVGNVLCMILLEYRVTIPRESRSGKEKRKMT